MTNNSFDWIPLDNAGKVFPGQNTERWSNVFRLSVQLKEEIDPDILKKALKRTFERLPLFRARIRNGFFWNYYESNEMECPVNEDIKNPCYRINFKENNGYLIRIYYHKCKISVDFYHALCDGYGGAVFLCTLTGEYLRQKGHSISCNRFVLDVNEKVKNQEIEDAYIRYATSEKRAKLVETLSYHKKGIYTLKKWQKNKTQKPRHYFFRADEKNFSFVIFKRTKTIVKACKIRLIQWFSFIFYFVRILLITDYNTYQIQQDEELQQAVLPLHALP